MTSWQASIHWKISYSFLYLLFTKKKGTFESGFFFFFSVKYWDVQSTWWRWDLEGLVGMVVPWRGWTSPGSPGTVPLRHCWLGWYPLPRPLLPRPPPHAPWLPRHLKWGLDGSLEWLRHVSTLQLFCLPLHLTRWGPVVQGQGPVPCLWFLVLPLLTQLSRLNNISQFSASFKAWLFLVSLDGSRPCFMMCLLEHFVK